MTWSTAPSRSGNSRGVGTSYGIDVLSNLCLGAHNALRQRTRSGENAFAISSVVSPHTSRKVSARAHPGARDGWQQVKSGAGDHLKGVLFIGRSGPNGFALEIIAQARPGRIKS